jgi:predicted RNase H-like HicB family nuclease
MATFKVLAHWDPDACVWWAESEDVKGLVGEAETIEQLFDDFKQTMPDLLRDNHGMAPQSVDIQLVADRTEGVRVVA